tara:strand:+ start:1517 stop:2278 length:762 start_codon:yes stop_codon:yes gene_type:complete
MSLEYNNSPYKLIPEEIRNEYTMNEKIPVFEWYFDGSKKDGVKWSNSLIQEHMNMFTQEKIKNKTEGPSPYGNEVCFNLLKSFEDYNIKNKNVAVVGSETPWIEAILLNMSNKVTTIEYNVPSINFEDIELQCKDYFNHFDKNTEIYDAIVTFSSIEHSGLGRYGDPLDPNGDIKTMNNIYKNLSEDGLVIWGAPVGKDAVTWNAHRIYGPNRLPLIFNNFKELKWYGRSKQQCFSLPLTKDCLYQPVVVLQK